MIETLMISTQENAQLVKSEGVLEVMLARKKKSFANKMARLTEKMV